MPSPFKNVDKYAAVPGLAFCWLGAFDVWGIGRKASFYIQPLELAALGAVTALYGFGLWLSRRGANVGETANAYGVATVIGGAFVLRRLVGL